MIEQLLAVTGAPPLQAIAEHWNRARGARFMPAWSQLNPREIAPFLSMTWSYNYDREKGVFSGRLAGDRIEAIVGKSFRGRNMSDLFSGAELEWLAAICRRVVTEPALHCGAGTISSIAQVTGLGERIILPLSQDGNLADGVLGATVYPDLGAGAALPLNFYEKEHWFPLRAG